MSKSQLRIFITKKADADEEAIYKYINRDFGKVYADKFRSKKIDLFQSLSLHPFAGRPAKGNASLRGFIISRQNKLVYKVTGLEVVIIRILNTKTKSSKRY